MHGSMRQNYPGRHEDDKVYHKIEIEAKNRQTETL